MRQTVDKMNIIFTEAKMNYLQHIRENQEFNYNIILNLIMNALLQR